MMDQPFTGERFWSGEDEAFFRRDGSRKTIRTRVLAPISVKRCLPRPAPITSPDEDHKASPPSPMPSACSASAATATITACWRWGISTSWPSRPPAHDIVPLIPIVERAGGVVTTWEGGDPRGGGRILAAATSAFMKRRSRCCQARLALLSAVSRTKGVERRPELFADARSRSCKISWREPRSTICAPALKRKGEVLDRLARYDLVVAGGKHEHRHADARRELYLPTSSIVSRAALSQPMVGDSTASPGAASSTDIAQETLAVRR